MTADAKDYKLLTSAEKRMYDLVLAQLIFMDSLQTNNLMDNINPYITAPEINACLSRQAYEEANHSKSYAVMVESISDNTDEIYDMWKNDSKLLEKNKYIAEVYKNLSGDITDTKIVLALFANQILEGLYFYAGFAAIYALGKSGKMLGSTQMIRFIQRDEVCLHPDTEILTAIGWVKIGEVKLTDDVAQFDLYDDNITFAKPLHKTWKDYDGEMYKIVDNRGNVIQHITVDHDIVLKYKRTHKLKDGKKYNYYVNKKDTLDNNLFNNTSWMITSGKKHDGDLRKISNYEKLLIVLQADGTIDKKRNGVNSGFQVLRFGFKKIRKIERLRNILKSLEKENVHYTESTSNDYTNFYVKVPNKMPIDKNFDWVPIDEVTTKWAMEFLHELQFWDGYIAKDRESLYYSSTNKNAFDKVIAICALSNYKFKTKIYKDNRKETFNDVYRLTWWRHTNLITTQNMKIKNVKYVGKVGCVTMPKGTIITRHEGQVVVTGNCHLLLFQNMINGVRKERPELFTLELEETVREMFRRAVELEASWGAYITQGQILGFTDGIILQYIQYLADKRLEAVGYKPEYNVSHPIPWVDGYASFNEQRTNFFEGNVANYSKGSISFDDF